jgi:hypothetical protein
MESGFQPVIKPTELTSLQMLCNWLEHSRYTRVSVIARFSKNRGGELRQGWDTLFTICEINTLNHFGEVEYKIDDEEILDNFQDRTIRWFRYGGAE